MRQLLAPFVSLRSSFWLLWAALTWLAGFAFEPCALAYPTTIVRPVLDMVTISHAVEGALYEESGDT
jgi:hypothetical protein